jgi:hypothetical protein
MKKLLSEKELDMIRGKMLVAAATPKELQAFLLYVTELEALLDRCDSEDFFGTEGWHREVGWDE